MFMHRMMKQSKGKGRKGRKGKGEGRDVGFWQREREEERRGEERRGEERRGEETREHKKGEEIRICCSSMVATQKEK